MAKVESYVQGTPSYVELVTPDHAVAKSFYGPLFGWEFEDFAMGHGDRYVVVTKEGDVVAGMADTMPGTEDSPAYWNVYLAVDDVDATIAKVEAAGGTVAAGPFDVMEYGRGAAIQDPAGARVNLWQAIEYVGSVRVNEPGTPIWNELVTPDLPAATAFYSDVIGVDWEAMPTEGGEYTCLVVQGRQVGGAMPPPMEGMPPHWNVYFNVVDIDATITRAKELGGTVVAPAFDVAGVGRMAVLADPQRALFNLMAG